MKWSHYQWAIEWGEWHGSSFKDSMKRLAQVFKNEMCRKAAWQQSTGSCASSPGDVGQLLEEEELGQLGVIDPITNPSTEWNLRSRYRLN